MPLLLKNFYAEQDKEKGLKRALKSLGISPKEVKACYFANTSALVYFKDEGICKLYSDLIPSPEEEKEIKLVHEYVERFKRLLEAERQAEVKAQQEEMRRLSGRERELLGRAILDLKGTKAGTKFHFHLVKFGRRRLIETEIASGDVVLISRGNPLKSDLTGTVLKVTPHSLTVAFENRPPAWVYKKGVRIDLYVNDIPFKRMLETLEELRHAKGRTRELRNILLGLKKPAPAKRVKVEEFFDTRLNQAQREAVSLALGAPDFFLVHGPPGTGKTSTLTELILHLVKTGHKVLATADSNIAADNLVLNLPQYPFLRIVRIGHPARVMEELERFSIYALFEEEEMGRRIKEGWEKIRSLMEKRDRFTKPTPAFRRGLSDEEILSLSSRGKGARGVKREVVRSMAEWIRLNQEIETRVSALKELEAEVFKKIISEADVVLSTNSMAKSEFLEGFQFDVAVIDEGSQQVEPSTLIAISKAKRFFLAGDHKQLPPTILSEEAKELEKTLFERLIEAHPRLSIMLEVQYRMNEKIMQFPNREFYGGKLIAAPEAKDRLLEDLGVSPPQRFKKVLSPSEALGFVDTSRINAPEFQPEGSTSYENFEEARICLELVEELLRMGLKREDIGVITPYAAQVKLLKELFREKGIRVEVNSVDGFQGREKEVILISFVRSNEEGEVGFLRDTRRLNVAITRPRRKLICIGDPATLCTHPVYKKFLSYLKEQGQWEVL